MNDKTIYEQLGGEPAIDKAVGLFYEKVLGDDLLLDFFQEVNVAVLKNHQKKLWTFITGGPNAYIGKDLRTAHKHLKIEDEHFDRVGAHMEATLKELGVPENLVNNIMEKVLFLRDEVLNR
jgi:hemoglobin